jgi:predicted HicB family RNase H-like nuclease
VGYAERYEERSYSMAAHVQVRLSDSEHMQLKIACALTKKSIGDFVKQAVTDALATQGQVPTNTKEKDHE